ncbi:RagB/SusD family nutrient uptake outer membrane protein [Hymenobacter sp. UYP22]|uniref:RagB/SusD family nutrient uptake outer membrane protein n=1 Tax=Hymenobacter sp. UYP22 TaxID=3156348 RepID=UPI003392A689
MKYHSQILWKALLSATLIGTLPACDILDQEPPTAFTIDETFADATRIEKSLIGVYDGLQNAEFLGGRALIYSDIRSGDTDVPTYFGNVGRYQMLSTDGFAASSWAGGYRTIFTANSFIQNLAANSGKSSAALEAQYTAEAKSIRALAMFHLVNLFAQPYGFTADASHPGVVLQLTAPKSAAEAFDPALRQARATVKEVYDQIEKDLLESIPVLPATYAGANSNIRITKGAAQALLSRVYLYKADYTKAADLAGQVITTGGYTLNASPLTPFRTYNTKESIFSVAHNPADNPNTNNAIGQHYGPDRRADITITPYFNLTSLSTTDLRRTQLIDSRGTNRFTAKFNLVDNYVPIVRYPEVLLNRAEALAQLNGVNTESITLLNQVRSRSTTAYPATSFLTKAALIDAILEERRLELAFEGHRLYDLLRYKRDIPPHSTIATAIKYNDPRVIFPIPDQQIRLNPNLVQNPSY